MNEHGMELTATKRKSSKSSDGFHVTPGIVVTEVSDEKVRISVRLCCHNNALFFRAYTLKPLLNSFLFMLYVYLHMHIHVFLLIFLSFFICFSG